MTEVNETSWGLLSCDHTTSSNLMVRDAVEVSVYYVLFIDSEKEQKSLFCETKCHWNHPTYLHLLGVEACSMIKLRMLVEKYLDALV